VDEPDSVAGGEEVMKVVIAVLAIMVMQKCKILRLCKEIF
jgi:hypothetical protein